MIEIAVHQISKSDKYRDGLKWGLICIDQKTGRRILMDNHHPKGPHIHINDEEIEYDFKGLDQLVTDFRRLVNEHLGVQI